MFGPTSSTLVRVDERDVESCWGVEATVPSYSVEALHREALFYGRGGER